MQNEEAMSLEEFTKQCGWADWRYDMSDDQRAWRRGKNHCEMLKNLAYAMGGEWLEVYEKATDRAYGRA